MRFDEFAQATVGFVAIVGGEHAAHGSGALAVIRRGQRGRLQCYPPRTFAQMVIEPKHIVTYSRHVGEVDRGWRWSVQLLPADAHAHRPLILLPEWESDFPARPERLTARVRELVRFIATATGSTEALVVKDGKPIARLRTSAELNTEATE